MQIKETEKGIEMKATSRRCCEKCGNDLLETVKIKVPIERNSKGEVKEVDIILCIGCMLESLYQFLHNTDYITTRLFVDYCRRVKK